MESSAYPKKTSLLWSTGNMDTFRGRVWSIVFNSGDYYIMQMEPAGGGRRVACRGSLFGVQSVALGLSLELVGRWVNHPKYGRQFEMTSFSPWVDTEADAELFLRSCLGVPVLRAGAIVDTFGKDTFTVLAETPSRLSDVPDMDEVAIEQTLNAWAMVKASSEVSAFLADHDVTSSQIRGVLEVFGVDALSIISVNPYRLVDVPDFPFVKADDVARSLGVSARDPRRYEGAVLWVLREATTSGHLCIRRGDISSSLRALVQGTNIDPFEDVGLSDEVLAAITRLEGAKRVVVDPNVGVYLPEQFRHERESARMLVDFLGDPKLDFNVDDFLVTYQESQRIELSEMQRDAIHKLIQNKVLVLTGLPGTGKTTVVRTIVTLFNRLGLKYSLMAPTGIAAKRLAAVTGQEASTIHRALGYDGTEWKYNQSCKYTINAVVIDEVSMVDQELIHRVLSALEPSTILVLVGDDAQLPSVGPGNVLRELIKCPEVPTVRLTQIFRQVETSDIIQNAHRINAGRDIQLTREDSDFRFVPIVDEVKAAQLIVQMSVKLKGRDANFQVLSPKYDGHLGVTNLNNLLREALNSPAPGKKEVVIEGQRYREGDRLMVIRNDYEKGVYNGDMGKLTRVGRDDLTLHMHGAGDGGVDMVVSFPKEEVTTKLRLAYAITVHKCQGSEFETIILPMVRTHGRMLQRNLFYTAVTRARKRVWVLGDKSAITKAIANDQVVQRGTALAKAITEVVHSGVRNEGTK
jgi:exodeoxyribonuclease V alpha subunit